jgi:hypothetical protein
MCLASINRLILVSILAIVVGASQSATSFAGMITQVVAKPKNGTKFDATDIHMAFEGIGATDDVSNLMGSFTDTPRVTSTDGGVVITFLAKNLGEAVKKGDTGEFKFEVKNAQNLKAILARWSGGPGLLDPPIKFPSIEVKGDPMVIFTDQLQDGVSLGIRNLRFAANIDEIPIGSLTFGVIPGLDSPRPDFTLTASPGSMMMFDLGPLQPGKFAYAQGDVFDPSTGVVENSFIFGIQGVPEPSSFVMASMGVLEAV